MWLPLFPLPDPSSWALSFQLTCLAWSALLPSSPWELPGSSQGPCIRLSLLEGLRLPVSPFGVMLYRSTLGRSIILLGEDLLARGGQVGGLGKAAGLAPACLAFQGGQETGRLRAPVPWIPGVKECGSQECLTRAEIAHLPLLILGSSSQHRVLISHPSLGPQLPASPTAAGVPHSCSCPPQFWPFGDKQWPLFPDLLLLF